MTVLEQQSGASYDLQLLLKTPSNQVIPAGALSEILANPPFLPIPHALNLRSVPLPSTSKIRFYRSGPVHYLTPADLDLLRSRYHIGQVYDLRSRREREKTPSAVVEGIETIWTPYTVDAGLENAQTEWVPVIKFQEGEGEEKGKEAWLEIYRNMLSSYRFVYKVVFEAVRDWKDASAKDKAILFHCTGMCKVLCSFF